MGAFATTLLVILVDTSVWIDHLRVREPALDENLQTGEALIHEFVVGELMLGTPPNRSSTTKLLEGIRRAPTMPTDSVLEAVTRLRLFGTGIGYVDAHLLCSCLATGAKFWTRDKRLDAVAERLGIQAKAE